jgi:putative transposase
MNKFLIYKLCGVSGKSFEKMLKHPAEVKPKIAPLRVLEIAKDVEDNYLLGCSSRELYKYIQMNLENYKAELNRWSQRSFEILCLSNGFRKVVRQYNPPTTVRADHWYENYIENTFVTDVDQVWVSDITYVYSFDGKRIGYATSILDIYSRKLLALVFSVRITAEQTAIPALKQAIKNRGQNYFPGLIFQSDCGGQFIDKGFKAIQDESGISGSMAQCCYDNAHSESYHDTLKNHQLSTTTIVNIAQLKVLAPKLMQQYNENKPHNSINRMTPDAFEKQLLLTPFSKRLPQIIQPSPLNKTKPNVVMILLSELDLEYKKKLTDTENI